MLLPKFHAPLTAPQVVKTLSLTLAISFFIPNTLIQAHNSTDTQMLGLNEIEENQMNQQRDLQRVRIMEMERSTFSDLNSGNLTDKALIKGQENPARFFSNPSAQMLTNIFQMDQMNLTRGQILGKPWSDDYWPISKGITSYRYGDDSFLNNGSWREFYNFFRSYPTSLYLQNQTTSRLSPAEKYDLLIGQNYTGPLSANVPQNMPLTFFNWRQGQNFADASGNVASWMGICHGWAAASYLVDRPLKKVVATSPTGKQLVFYPADLKALMSQLWANTKYPTYFVGGRCNVKNPQRDPANGRIIDENCFDNNPGVWHQVVVGRVGKMKKSLVMDITYDQEVWNQPILSYSYSYFNPITKKSTNSLAEAMVDVARFPQDPFRKYRSNQVRNIVGIKMDVTYLVENNPNQSEFDDFSGDEVDNAQYRYDLELDSRGQIIGGEWHTKNHPDFLWSPVDGYKTSHPQERSLQGLYTNPSQQRVPAQWLPLAKQAASTGVPLEKILSSLISTSRR
jgi:hypothetical protein